MSHPPDSRTGPCASGERGASRLSFIIVLLLIAAAAFVAYKLVPVFYNASLYKVYMQDTVNKAAATGKDEEWVRTELRSAGAEYGVPQGAVIDTRVAESRLTARVRWTRPVELPGYTYRYSFDHTVTSDRFLSSSR